MQAGCYSLDLYCDGDSCPRYRLEYAPFQPMGETASECRAKARKAGWLVSTTAGLDLCPECRKVAK